MHTYSRAFYELKNKLQPLYDEREAVAIAHELLYHITKLNKTQRLLQKETIFTETQQRQYEAAINKLIKGTPLQYVTHSAWFMDREYYVNEHVLIPRPETEELVQWILDEITNSHPDDHRGQTPIPIAIGTKLPIIDIGAGSGCIPVSLKLALPFADVTACDISNEALNVAKENAKRSTAEIEFLQLDFLDSVQRDKLGKYAIIVSNPPYIPLAEKEKLHNNVKDYEPGIALFVPDDDALVFYHAIAAFGKEHLNSNGMVYCELDAAHAMECKALFEEAGYKNAEVRKDMHGNWRMLKAML